MPRAAVLLVLLLCCIFLAARPARAQSDDWWGRDKLWHAGLSAAVGAGGYGAASLFTASRPLRLTIGAGTAILAGTGKELYDLTGHGDPSWRDFTWDLVGTATGTGIAFLIDLLLRPEPGIPPAPQRPQATRAPGVHSDPVSQSIWRRLSLPSMICSAPNTIGRCIRLGPIEPGLNTVSPLSRPMNGT